MNQADKDLLETIRDVLTIRRLAMEVFEVDREKEIANYQKLMHLTDTWLQALLLK